MREPQFDPPGLLSSDALTIGLVGSGRAASAIGRGLDRAGHDLVVARRGPGAVALAGALGARLLALGDLLAAADVTFLAVPDKVVGPLALQLADGSAAGEGRLVAHLAGSLGRDVLKPLAERGYMTAAIHPLQVLSGWRIAGGTGFAVEAEGSAREVAERLVADLGGMPLAIAPAGRAAYHAGAVIASNLAMTMMAEAVDLLDAQGIPRAQALQSLGTLVRGGLEAAMDQGLPAAITGPVARGDVATVTGHLEALAGDPDLRRAYAATSLLALRQVRRDGRPDEAAADDVRRVLEAVL